MKLDDHPTVQLLRRTSLEQSFPRFDSILDAVWLGRFTVSMTEGARRGFVELARPGPG